MVACPKGGARNPHRAYRVYSETTSPKTGRSTKVTLPYVYCGTLATRVVGGRVVGVFEAAAGQHGLVPLDLAVFQVARRRAIAAVSRSHPEWVGTPKAPAPAKPAAKAKPKARPKAKTPAKPKAKAPRKARARPRAVRPPAGAPASPLTLESPVTDAGGAAPPLPPFEA